MTPLLEIANLSVSYDKAEAVRNVSLTVGAGEIVTVIGPNGAGKTTLLGAAMGLLPSTGALLYQGRDLARADVEDRVAAGLCLVPEKRELFGDMTVADNLLLGAYLKRRDAAAVRARFDDVYGHFPRLAERRQQKASTLSGGERQMLALGRALMGAPKLLMLDEPSLGLAPLIVIEILGIIARLRRMGTAVLLVEQNARAALEIADRGYVLETGEIVLSGPSGKLLTDPRISAIYLGGSARV